MNKEVLITNIDKIHTTELGKLRIMKNLDLKKIDIVDYCKTIVLNDDCNIYKDGKNWYCDLNGVKLTINSYSYTIITAHKIK